MLRTALVAMLLTSVVLSGCISDQSDDAPVDTPQAGTAIGGLPTPAPGSRPVEPYPPGEYKFDAGRSQVLEAGIYDILPQGEINLPSTQDGEPIQMGLWLPDVPAGTKVPVLLFSSPYFTYGNIASAQPSPNGSVPSLIHNFVPHGYAVATHAVRGTAGSGGCNDLMGPKETLDIDQAVTWLGTQDWSNGNVGMTGVSYDGSTPWAVASLGNPHLKTIVPISGVPDMYGLMYRNGSSETRGPVLLNALYVAGGIQSAPPEDWVERAACPDAFEGLALSGVASTTGTDPTGWWQERNRKPHVESNYEGSIFSIQGLQDWNVDPSQVVPWVDELDAMGLKTKQLLGQWGHAWPDYTSEDMDASYRADWKEVLLRWMDSELKGLDVDTGPPVQVRDNLGRWRNEAHYPPRDAEWLEFHLTNGMALEPEPRGQSSITLMPVVDESLIPSTPDAVDAVPVGLVADFTTLAMDSDMLIAGLPKVHVTVTPQGPGGYMAAYLYAKSPTGELDRLGWTTMNLGYADGTTELTPVVPQQPLRAMMEIQPMDGVVPAGHELMLRLWVFTDGDRLPTIPPTGVDLEIGHAMGSVLKLPVIERSDDVYFMPPLPPQPEE